jgi:xylulokinase
VLGHPVLVPSPGEYVADGAARQAAWVLAAGAEPPRWSASDVEIYQADPTPGVRERYADVRELTARRPDA